MVAPGMTFVEPQCGHRVGKARSLSAASSNRTSESSTIGTQRLTDGSLPAWCQSFTCCIRSSSCAQWRGRECIPVHHRPLVSVCPCPENTKPRHFTKRTVPAPTSDARLPTMLPMFPKTPRTNLISVRFHNSLSVNDLERMSSHPHASIASSSLSANRMLTLL